MKQFLHLCRAGAPGRDREEATPEPRRRREIATIGGDTGFMKRKSARIGPALSILLLLVLIACRRSGPADVKEVVSSPSGSLHAARLFQYGSATVGTSVFVAIFRGKAPAVGSEVQVEDQCYVFEGYRTGPWKMTWESETRLALAIDGDRSYEDLIDARDCYGVHPRWFYANEPQETPVTSPGS